ncbi:DUF4296 domain-containing protein [Lutibacter citreus]|uniref:DUF4296 domain-containing protein n=1 Tax=Lutibacter citreus TaxID=2138210 RepID=UPI000DBE3482|nr:DUF4296 domain-containing protein [Lutibacter citreus]
MNKIFILLFTSLFICSCTSNTILEKPENLIPKDQMVDVLTDMFVAASAENIKNIDLKRKVNYYPLVFEKYKIDSSLFKESNLYYTSIVDDYEDILNKVENRLKELDKKYEIEKKLEDSISKANLKLKTLNKEKSTD